MEPSVSHDETTCHSCQMVTQLTQLVSGVFLKNQGLLDADRKRRIQKHLHAVARAARTVEMT